MKTGTPVISPLEYMTVLQMLRYNPTHISTSWCNVCKSSFSFFFTTEPAAVSQITVSGTTTTLDVSWTPAVGRVDFYTVNLYRDSQSVENSSNLANNTLRTQFSNLVPGVIYRVEVVTHSGNLVNKNTVYNATCELHHELQTCAFVQHGVCVCAASILTISWCIPSPVQFQTLLAPSWWSLRLWTPSPLPGSVLWAWTIVSTTSACPTHKAPIWLKTTPSCWTISSLEVPTISLLSLLVWWSMRAQQWRRKIIPVSVVNTHLVTPGS